MGTKISVIMPAYNAEKTCESAIQSVLAQNLKELEIIIIDDGSRDGTLQKCTELSKKDSRVHVLHQENKGVSAARNVGLKEATGEYVCFVDSDDAVVPHMFDILYQAANEEKPDFVICGHYTVKEGNTISQWIPKTAGNIRELCEQLLRSDVGLNPLWTKMFKRDVIRQPFNIEKTMGEDLEFICDFLIEAKTCAVVQKPLYLYTSDTVASLTKCVDSILCAIPDDMIARLKLTTAKELPERFVHDKFYSQIEGVLNRIDSFADFKRYTSLIEASEQFHKMIDTYKPLDFKNIIIRFFLHRRYYIVLFRYLQAKRKVRKLKNSVRGRLAK